VSWDRAEDKNLPAQSCNHRTHHTHSAAQTHTIQGEQHHTQSEHLASRTLDQISGLQASAISKDKSSTEEFALILDIKQFLQINFAGTQLTARKQGAMNENQQKNLQCKYTCKDL
jgi:hypothetical protein